MECESKPADSSSEALGDNSSGATKPELSHVEALLRVKDLTAQLLSDPFLQDLPPDISLDEVKSKLALEQGSAITLNLRKFNDEMIRKLQLEFAMSLLIQWLLWYCLIILLVLQATPFAERGRVWLHCN